MAKKGMKRISRTHTKEKNASPAVPEIQGSAKHSDTKVNPIISGTFSPSQKVYHTAPHSADKPIASVYAEIETDLARDNLENDNTAADLQDM